MKQDKENIEKRLTEMFEAARSEKSPFGQSNLSAMLNKAPKTAIQKPLTHIKTILMTASIATLGIIITYSIITFSGDSKLQPMKSAPISAKAETQHSSPSENLVQSETIQNVSPAKQEKKPKPITNDDEKDKQPFEIKGENLVTLPEETLKHLGITYTKDGICLLINEAFSTCYNQRGTRVWYDKEKTQGKGLQIHPLMVTDDLGQHWRSTALSAKLESEFKRLYPDISSSDTDFARYDKAIHSFINTKISSLIPILMHLPEEYLMPEEELGKEPWRPDVIFWYEPSVELSNIINGNKDSLIVTQVDKTGSAVTPSTSDEPIALPAPAKTGITSIYPNPAVDETIVLYYLENKKAVSIALHDITGKLVNVYVNGERKNAGENQLTINVKDLIPGIYLLSIQTEDGNILSQRLIKQ